MKVDVVSGSYGSLKQNKANNELGFNLKTKPLGLKINE